MPWSTLALQLDQTRGSAAGRASQRGGYAVSWWLRTMARLSRQLLTMLGLLVNRIENHFSQLTPTLWRALAYCAQLRLFFVSFIITSAQWSRRSAEKPFSPYEQDQSQPPSGRGADWILCSLSSRLARSDYG